MEQNTEIDPRKYSQLIFEKGAKATNTMAALFNK